VIDGMGGMVAAIEAGYPQREIAESAYRDQQAVESQARTIVGVNAFVASRHEPLNTLHIDEAAEQEQRSGLDRLRRERDAGRVAAALEALQAAAAGAENTMPRLLDAVRADATVGEMCDALREVWGEYEEVPII
jgi:methylmalonyl-CoA mutase N-terminal domain/subunit